MNILLTGARGQVGREIALRAEHHGCRVIALGHGELDITLGDAVEEALELHNPDWVVNAAAHTAVDKAEEEEKTAFAINALGPSLLATALARRGTPLLHISTDYIFHDAHQTTPWREEDLPQPRGVYARTKWAGEEAVRQRHAKHLILRVAWVFGPHGKNFVKTIVGLAKQRDELGIVADQWGSPTPAAAIAETILTLLPRAGEGTWGTYHYAGAPATTWHGFTEEILSQAGERLGRPIPRLNPLTTDQFPRPAPRPPYSVLGCERIRQVFGIEQPDWRQHLEPTLREALA